MGFWDELVSNFIGSNKAEPQWVQDIRSGKTKIYNSDGTISTMKSITFTADDGKVYLAPSIRVIGGKPVSLTAKQAIDYARMMQDAIPFNSQDEADAYDKRFHEQEYKRLGVGPSPKNKWP